MGNTTCKPEIKGKVTPVQRKKIIQNAVLYKNLELIDKLDPNLQKEAITEWLTNQENRKLIKTVWKDLLTQVLSPQNLTRDKSHTLVQKLLPIGEKAIHKALLLPKVREKLSTECASEIQGSRVRLSFPPKIYQKMIDNEIENNKESWLGKLQKLFDKKVKIYTERKIEHQSELYQKAIESKINLYAREQSVKLDEILVKRKKIVKKQIKEHLENYMIKKIREIEDQLIKTHFQKVEEEVTQRIEDTVQQICNIFHQVESKKIIRKQGLQYIETLKNKLGCVDGYQFPHIQVVYQSSIRGKIQRKIVQTLVNKMFEFDVVNSQVILQQDKYLLANHYPWKINIFYCFLIGTYRANIYANFRYKKMVDYCLTQTYNLTIPSEHDKIYFRKDDETYSFDYIPYCENDPNYIEIKGLNLIQILIKLLTSYPIGIFNKSEYQKNVRDLITYLSDKPAFHTPVPKNTLSTYREKECVICMDNIPNVLYLECKHQCVCSECINMVDKCPLCRGLDSETLQIGI